MPELILNTTVGSPEANSYGTLEEMHNYFKYISSAFTFLTADEDVQIAYMIQAARINDTMLTPFGIETYSDQALLFPRTKLVDKHGRVYASDEIPKQVKWAQFEEANYLFNTGSKLPSNLMQGFSSAKLDTMSITLDKDFIPLKIDNDASDFLLLFGTLSQGTLSGISMVDVWRY